MPWVLYSRRGCHLCEEAEDLVLSFRSDTLVLDVDADAVALERYDHRVPVLVIGGEVAAEGRFAEADVARLAAGRPSDA